MKTNSGPPSLKPPRADRSLTNRAGQPRTGTKNFSLGKLSSINFVWAYSLAYPLLLCNATSFIVLKAPSRTPFKASVSTILRSTPDLNSTIPQSTPHTNHTMDDTETFTQLPLQMDPTSKAIS